MRRILEPAIFACVGVAASLVHMGTGVLLVERFGLSPWLANIFAFMTAFPVSFLGHSYLTFSAQSYGRVSPVTQSSFRRFLTIAVAGFSLSQASVVVFAEMLGYPPRTVIVATVVAVAGFLFVASKIWAFRGAEARLPGNSEMAKPYINAASTRAMIVQWFETLQRRPQLALIGLCVLLLAPSLLLGVGPSYDLEPHYAWARAFPAALFSGEIYPRWLQDTMHGMGTPAFYFYPPLAYYVCALLTLPLGGATSYVLADTAFLFFVASALVMHAWLRRFASPLLALGGAALFAAAPYHLLIDHYIRGAFAEFAAIVFVPLIALALAEVRERARWGFAKLALAYAGLIYCHLPTALLVSLFLIPPYVVFLALQHDTWRDRLLFAGRAMFAGACGLALAAPYLGVALSLREHMTADAMAISPNTYLPLRPDLWPARRELYFTAIGAVVFGWLILAAGLAWRRLRRRAETAPPEARAREATFWAVLGALAAAAVMGLAPGLWSIPLLEQVQFPWRLMPIVEFAAITALAAALSHRSGPWALRIAGAALLVAVGGVLVLSGFAARNVVRTVTNLPAWTAAENEEMFDAPEYLPPGFFERNEDPHERLRAARAAPEIAAVDDRAHVSVTASSHGLLRVTADTAIETRIVVRRFYFPGWVANRVRDGALIPVEAYGADRLVSFVASPGESYVVRRTTLPVERRAWWLGALGAVVLLLWSLASRRKTKAPLTV